MKLQRTAAFERDLRRLRRKHYDMDKMIQVLKDLREYDTAKLQQKYRDHKLKGRMKQFKELHIQADWLLVYQPLEDKVALLLIKTGDHDHSL